MAKQAQWNEPLLITFSHPDRSAFDVPEGVDEEINIPSELIRQTPPNLPQLSQVDVVRHYTRLSQMNFCVDSGFYPLGSCTMKYNPKINEKIAADSRIAAIHPDQPESTIQGLLEMLHSLQTWLCEISGMDAVTLQPAAGAHGEFVGMLIMKSYFEKKGDLERTEIIVPDSAHGTNPASAAMAGFNVIEIPSDENGCVDIAALKEVVSEKTAGLMLTNPNTIGVFEKNIEDIVDIVHEAGGLCYYDGANLNAILGICRPGDMGFDIIHFNLHKTFSTPHGGGGPGSGPVGVKEELKDYLPVPVIKKENDVFSLDYSIKNTIGKVKNYFGNVGVLVRAYTYIKTMGYDGLRAAGQQAVINANYLNERLKGTRGLTLPYHPEVPRKHETVFSVDILKEECGIDAIAVAKRLLDFGVHAPTINFPIIVHNALMIEPTESEPLEEIDYFIDCLKQVSKEAYDAPSKIKTAPSTTASSLIDDVAAVRNPVLSWKMIE